MSLQQMNQPQYEQLNKERPLNIPVQAFSSFFFCSVFMDHVMFVLFLNGNCEIYMNLIWGVFVPVLLE